MMPSLTEFLSLAALLFGLGMAGIIVNRNNLIALLMSIELILLAVNTNFVAFSYFLGNVTGQLFVFFVLTVAAAEAAIGLAILVVLYRKRGTIRVKELDGLRG
ncbi:MAG TPA: NADH-quinone oxidoreductase subunit NuoK [Gammaproteobacteria bacterium]|nr:NADH-quinone oxidoreductase subunit NuoK [Gammaproteobacteria bacterium]